MEEARNIYAQMKRGLELLSEFPGLTRDIIDMDHANKVLDAHISNPPVPDIPKDILKYSQELTKVQKKNDTLLKNWIKLIDSVPKVGYDIDINFIGTQNIISGCFPIDEEELRDEDSIYSGSFAEIDFDDIPLQGTWEDVYKKLVDFMKKLLEKTIPETP